MADSGTEAEKVQDVPLERFMTESKERSRNDADVIEGHRHRLEGAPSDHNGDNLNIQGINIG